jgi:hypothetical protein
MILRRPRRDAAKGLPRFAAFEEVLSARHCQEPELLLDRHLEAEVSYWQHVGPRQPEDQEYVVCCCL